MSGQGGQSAAELVAQLAEAGTPPQLLAAVAKELFNAETERAALADRRKNERERKARSREVTGQDVTECDTPSLEVSPAPLPNPIHDNAPLIPPKKRVKKAAFVFHAPEWMPPEPWLAFVAMRERKDRQWPWGLDAANRVVSRLETLRGQGHCPTKLLDKAVMNGWRAPYPGEDTIATAATPAKPFDQATYEARLAKIGRTESTGPPRPIGKLASGIMRGMGNG